MNQGVVGVEWYVWRGGCGHHRLEVQQRVGRQVVVTVVGAVLLRADLLAPLRDADRQADVHREGEERDGRELGRAEPVRQVRQGKG